MREIAAELARWLVVISTIVLASLPIKAALPEAWSIAILALVAALAAKQAAALAKAIRTGAAGTGPA